MKSARRDWVLLAFRLPASPSTPRIAVWRKLKRLGAVQLGDGMVALPLEPGNQEQLEWVAQEVTENGGEARLWIGRPASAADERELVRQMRETVAGDYERVIAESEEAAAQPPGRRRRSLGRLRRELRRVRERDYFPPPERELAQQAVDALALSLDGTAAPEGVGPPR